MTTEDEAGDRKIGLSRRQALTAAGLCCFAARSVQGEAAVAAAPSKQGYSLEREAEIKRPDRVIHRGKKTIDTYRYTFANASRPARFIVYDLPPGASEGVHVHHLDNRNGEGAFDEYYYIVSGEGVMEIDGTAVAVRGGDHVHTPLDVAHGIENTHPTETLKVFLTFIGRGVSA